MISSYSEILLQVFWLIPPTDDNLKLYEEWTLYQGIRGKEAKWGKIILDPRRVHARDQRRDWGKLNSFAIEKQLQVAQID